MTTTLFGITFDSEIDLPGAAADAEPADVTVRRADVPEEIAGVRSAGVAYQAAPGRFLSFMPGLASFLIEDGRTITFDAAPSCSEDTVRLLLMGTPMGALLHQRERVPLHASAVEIDGKAILFAGHSASGKSAIAAALHAHGHRVVADDICAVSAAADGTILAEVGPTELLLWRDALGQLDGRAKNFLRARSELEKYRYPVEVASGPVPVERLFLLGSHNSDVYDIGAIEHLARIRVLLDQTRGSGYLEGLGAGPRHFSTTTGIASRVRMQRLIRPREATIGGVGDKILELIDAPESGASGAGVA